MIVDLLAPLIIGRTYFAFGLSRSTTKRISMLLCIWSLTTPMYQCQSQKTNSSTEYTHKEGSPNGIGKWYMGREIAHVMGFQGMRWLERPEREKEENTKTLIENMTIRPNDNIADIGAGSGYHSLQMARLAAQGTVYAVDIQEEMLEALRKKKETAALGNIKLIRGNEINVNLPKNTIDKVLMVDVYHEFSHPIEMIASIRKALRDDGQLFLIEYRGEDKNVPIKKLHKMTEAQAVREMRAAGFKLKRNINNLPWQHCMVFIKN